MIVMEPMFSILVVCLNPGGKIKETLRTIAVQNDKDYEVIIKDGFSTDGSLAFLEAVHEEEKEDGMGIIENLPFRLVRKKDTGIYDAMNQAVREAKGKYVYFLNCGDLFAHPDVLADFHKLIVTNPAERGIYYGNICTRETGEMVPSNPQMDAFGCYRNVPCHQACFYDRELLLAHPFETKYRVRADYEHFLWCFLQKKRRERYLLFMEILLPHIMKAAVFRKGRRTGKFLPKNTERSSENICPPDKYGSTG